MIKLRGGQAVPSEPDKLFVLAGGFPGVGKTSFACSFPSPLWVANYDRPATPIFKQLPSHYEINYESFSYDVDGIPPPVAAKVLTDFDRFMGEAIASGEGSFIWDGADLFWEIVKVAKLPSNKGADDAIPREYADANTYMMQILRRLHMSKLQVCMTTLATHEWGGAKQETRRVRNSGFRHSGRYLTHELYLFAPEGHASPLDLPTEAPKTGQSHHAYVMQSKINESLVGSVIPNPSFKLLWRLVFGEPHPKTEQLWLPGAASAPAAS